MSGSIGLQGGGTWRSVTLNNPDIVWIVGHENAALQIGGNGRTQKTAIQWSCLDRGN